MVLDLMNYGIASVGVPAQTDEQLNFTIDMLYVINYIMSCFLSHLFDQTFFVLDHSTSLYNINQKMGGNQNKVLNEISINKIKVKVF